jgi:branched-chain amino acid aminotransferase
MRDREAILADPGFGRHLTDHMATATWTADNGWSPVKLEPVHDLALSPAAMVLHYGQAIFEGLKAYRQPDGSVAMFRAADNAARLNRSAERMAMPTLPVEMFLEACHEVVRADVDWVPTREGQSLYLRPFMFATEANLGVRTAAEQLFSVIASPVDTFFAGGVRPIAVCSAGSAVRAAPGGLGAAKCAANYSASLRTKVDATAAGFDEVLWLDSTEHRFAEELSGMNLFVVRGDTIVTPPISDTILEGITRASLLQLAPTLGYQVREEPIEVTALAADEAFACGTAAVIAPIGRIDDTVLGDGGAGAVTLRLRDALLSIQEGRADDPFGWVTAIA